VRAAVLGARESIGRVEVTSFRNTGRSTKQFKAVLGGPVDGLIVEWVREIDESVF
jgi:hypothetical protein